MYMYSSGLSCRVYTYLQGYGKCSLINWSYFVLEREYSLSTRYCGQRPRINNRRCPCNCCSCRWLDNYREYPLCKCFLVETAVYSSVQTAISSWYAFVIETPYKTYYTCCTLVQAKWLKNVLVSPMRKEGTLRSFKILKEQLLKLRLWDIEICLKCKLSYLWHHR